MVATRWLRFLVLAGMVLTLAAVPAGAGPCGHCDRGLPCPRTQPSPSAPGHACCDGGADEAAPVDISLSAARCDCGGDPPPAVVAADPAAGAAQLAVAPVGGPTLSAAASQRAVLAARQPPAPPPPAPFYLLDCAFLI
jgi:hypothetical protein